MAVNRGYLKKRKNPKSDEVIGAQFVCYSHQATLLAVKISSVDITKSTKDKQTNKQTNKHSLKHAKMTKNIFGIIYSFPVW